MCDQIDVVLHVRCAGCTKLYQQSVALPAGHGAPSDGDELMEYPEIRAMAFKCPKCEAPYAEIVAFKVRERRAA
jgi:phage FluMu protein Com